MPAGNRRRGHRQRVLPGARRAFEEQRNRLAAFRCKLEAAGLRHRDPPRLADHRRQPAVAQPLLHQGEQLGIVVRLGVQQPVGGEARLVEPRREQVAGAQHPQHRAVAARNDPRDEQRRRRIVAPPRAHRRNLVQRIEPQSPVRQPIIQPGDAERLHRPRAAAIPGKEPNGFAQSG